MKTLNNNNFMHGNATFETLLDWKSKAESNSMTTATILIIVIVSLYWLLIASDRYVSESHIVIQQTEISGNQSVDFSGLLSGSPGLNRSEQLLLREYLLSIDMLKKLDTRLNLRAHYSAPEHDFLSRLWTSQSSAEQFYKYFRDRVNIELDDYSGVLIIRVEAFTPQIAHQIVQMLVIEGEAYMNALANDLAKGQVSFLEAQVALNNTRALQARQILLNFQNKKGMVSPQATTENLVSLIAKLESQKAELETQRTALQSYLVPSHPSIVMLNQQIAAINNQLIQEQSRLAAPNGKTLNRTVEEFQRLEAEANFTQDIYKTTLIALEKVKVESSRTIKKVSILQSPTFPEYPLQPSRIYNTLVSIIFILLIAFIGNLLMAIVRDHKD